MTALAVQFEHPIHSGKRIFNHDTRNCTHETVVGNDLYSGRALCMTAPEDIIQMNPLLRSQWPHIAAHYARIGLRHTYQVLWDVSYSTLAQYPDHELSVFFFGDTVQAARQDHDWSNVVEYINSKNNFMALADELGLATPKTFCYADKSEIKGTEGFPFPCYLKAAVSVAGAGIYRCEDADAFQVALTKLDDEVPLQVQEEVETQLFLNLQYETVGCDLRRLAATEQVLDGFVHQGNRFPASHAPWSSVEPMAEWMVRKGMRGIFAFDVGVVERKEGLHFAPIECNPRFNGASYPTGIANKLGLDQWMGVQLHTPYRSLADIDLTGIEFDPHSRTGVILVNWGTILKGKLVVLLAGTPETQNELKLEFEKRLW